MSEQPLLLLEDPDASLEGKLPSSAYRREDHYTKLNWRVDLPVPFPLGRQTELLKDVLMQYPDPPWSRDRWSFRAGAARFESEQQAMAVGEALIARLSRRSEDAGQPVLGPSLPIHLPPM